MGQPITIDPRPQIVRRAAILAHEAWRREFDPVYAATETPSKELLKNGKNLHVLFDELPDDFTIEYLAASNAANAAVQTCYGDIEGAAATIHNAWTRRNPKADWNAHKYVSYAELPEEEKQKARDQVHLILRLVREQNETAHMGSLAEEHKVDELEGSLSPVDGFAEENIG